MSPVDQQHAQQLVTLRVQQLSATRGEDQRIVVTASGHRLMVPEADVGLVTREAGPSTSRERAADPLAQRTFAATTTVQLLARGARQDPRTQQTTIALRDFPRLQSPRVDVPRYPRWPPPLANPAMRARTLRRVVDPHQGPR